MYTLTTSMTPETNRGGLIFRLTDGQQDHPTPPGQDEDDELLEEELEVGVTQRDKAQPEPKVQ